MVVKMKKWSPWHHHQPPPSPPVTESRKFKVKVERIKLERFEHGGGGLEKVMGVELRWKGEHKHGLAAVGFHRRWRVAERWCKERVVRKGEVIVWEEDDDLENVCWFSRDDASSSNGYGIDGYNKFVPWIVTFKFTYGEYNKGKMAVIGKVSVNVAEFDSPVIEKKLPVDLEIAGLTTPATVSVLLSYVEIRDSGELVQPTQSEDVNEDVKGKKKLSLEEVSLSDSDNSVIFDSDSTTESRGASQSSSSDSVPKDKKAGFFDWKRRRLNRKAAKTKARANLFSGDWVVDKPEYKNLFPNLWEAREFISRDGESKLDTSAFFASFDQCSDKAAGPSACTALVTVIAHWLGSHGSTVMPTVEQFDDLIVDGSAEWRNLCEKGTHVAEFPDRHFDLETVITAGILPLSVSREKSFVGFFSPEKFESLSGVMSFDDIWDREISRSPGVYIVSWNDHFFVLKAEEDGYYLIDTLGERLAEGCNQAYILRFDRGSCLTESRNGRVICEGKECCKEFIKRFLAAIPLKELEMEEQKQAVPYYSLHHRLQIEFNFCSTV